VLPLLHSGWAVDQPRPSCGPR